MPNNAILYLAHLAFELTLFGVFLYYTIYVAMRYVTPALRTGLEESVSHMHELTESKDKAIENREESEHALRTQQQTLDEFEHKMKQWFEKMKEEEHEIKKNQQVVNARLREKRHHQAFFLQRKIELSTLLPQTLMASEEALKKRLAGQGAANLLQTYIEKLGEGKQTKSSHEV